MPKASAHGGSDGALAPSSAWDVDELEPEVTRTLAWSWAESIRRHLVVTAASRESRWKTDVQTAASEHAREYGHPLSLGCCKVNADG